MYYCDVHAKQHRGKGHKGPREHKLVDTVGAVIEGLDRYSESLSMARDRKKGVGEREEDDESDHEVCSLRNIFDFLFLFCSLPFFLCLPSSSPSHPLFVRFFCASKKLPTPAKKRHKATKEATAPAPAQVVSVNNSLFADLADDQVNHLWDHVRVNW
jgi:hypothetical protein